MLLQARQTPQRQGRTLPPPGKGTAGYGQQAGGRHPTGMHIFYEEFYYCRIKNSTFFIHTLQTVRKPGATVGLT